jgi:flavin reductase (DIM6/NTAB) family NADH-FMN oxidoreductase RutF
MSSAFWLGWRCVLGLAAHSKTPQNLMRTGECVLNLPSVQNVAAVNRLARTTGSDPVPLSKAVKGYRHKRNKFELSGLTPIASDSIAAPRALECPVQLEAVLESTHRLAEDDAELNGRVVLLEVRVQRVHVEESILDQRDGNRIDPDQWRPLIMSFQHFYGLDSRLLHPSTLAEIPEYLYRTPDIERARGAGRCDPSS